MRSETVDREKVKKAKDVLDRIIGQNIRVEREVRNLSRDELAEILDLTTSHMGLIERGERGATGVTLMKLSRALDKPIDNFFYESKDSAFMSEDSDIDNLEVNRKKISSLVAYLTEKELNFIIDMIKGIIRLNHSHTTGYDDLNLGEQ